MHGGRGVRTNWWSAAAVCHEYVPLLQCHGGIAGFVEGAMVECFQL